MRPQPLPALPGVDVHQRGAEITAVRGKLRHHPDDEEEDVPDKKVPTTLKKEGAICQRHPACIIALHEGMHE